MLLLSSAVQAETYHGVFNSVLGDKMLMDISISSSGTAGTWNDVTSVSGTLHSEFLASIYGANLFTIMNSPNSLGDNLFNPGVSSLVDPYDSLVTGRAVTTSGITFRLAGLPYDFVFNAGGHDRFYAYSVSNVSGPLVAAYFDPVPLNPVPEPGMPALFLSGLAAVGWHARRTSKARQQAHLDPKPSAR
jgi:hypothetical protein